MKHILIILGIFFLVSCKAKVEMALPSNRLYFTMQQEGRALTAQDWESVRFFYVENGTDTIDHITDRNLADYGKPLIYPPSRYQHETTLDTQGVRAGGYPLIFAKHGVNTFYFEHPNGDIDTLYLELSKVTNKLGKTLRCYCNDPITRILFNGKTPREHPSLRTNDGKVIYVFEK